jgi:hypothetical protein
MSERGEWRDLPACRDAVRDAAARLRHSATQDAYAGLTHPEFAYGCASLLDLVALNLDDLPADVAGQLVGIIDAMRPRR